MLNVNNLKVQYKVLMQPGVRHHFMFCMYYFIPNNCSNKKSAANCPATRHLFFAAPPANNGLKCFCNSWAKPSKIFIRLGICKESATRCMARLPYIGGLLSS